MSKIILIILPLIAVGIAMVLLIKGVKKKNETRKTFEDEKINQDEENKEEDYMSMGMSLGMCFGVAIGSAFTSTFGGKAITYGICFGMLGGMLIGMTMKKK